MSLHLGWCAPLPPARSGIADYGAELLPALAERCDVTCFVDAPADVAPELQQHLRLRPLADVLTADDVLPVYHVGNHVQFHGDILRAALQRPGVAVLHEIVLYDLVERLLLGAGQAAGFAEWVRAADPGVTGALVQAVLRGRTAPHELPLCEPIVHASRGTIVFNTWAAEQVQRRCPDAAVQAVPQQSIPPPANTADVAQLRARYGLPADGFVVGSFGYQTSAKRLDVALQAFAQLRADVPDSVYLCAGPASPRVDIPGMAARLGVGDAVRTLGYVSETMWWDLLACTDLCVSLRGPTQGETSGSILKQMGAGKAVCVSAAGPDTAYPGDAVCHIPQSDDEADQLWAAMRRAATDPDWRAQLGAAAEAYVRDRHGVMACADAMIAACERAAAQPAPAAAFDFDGALHTAAGLAAAWNRWRYRMRLARRVGVQHGWPAVVRGVRTQMGGVDGSV